MITITTPKLSLVGYGMIIGSLPGLAYAAFMCVPELIRRVSHVAGGGRGETAVWGEPCFYLVVMAFTYGGVGALAGAALGAIITHFTGTTPENPP